MGGSNSPVRKLPVMVKASSVFRYVKAALAVSMILASPAQAQLLDTVRATAERNLEQESQLDTALAELDPKTVESNEERAVILFSRGLNSFEAHPKEAQKNFKEAQSLLKASSPLYALVGIYEGRASLTPSNARTILAKLKTMTKGSLANSSLWRSEKYALMLEIVMLLKQDTLLAKTWNDMTLRVKPSMRDQSISKKIVHYIETRGVSGHPDLITIIESLASTYPHYETGRWAFQKLQQLSCQSRHPYVFSTSLINRLSGNLNLDEGLKSFLIEITKGPLRRLSGQVAQFDETERINYLYQIRLWNEARRLTEEQVDRLKMSQTRDSKIRLSKALSLLGQIEVRQGDYEMAAKTWSLYLELFPNQADWRMAQENLADSLSRLRIHQSAAKLYESLARSANVEPVIRWHHFWNLYLAGDYDAALALLDRGNYVPLRDRGIDGGLDYWRARILEKLKKTDEAEVLYKKILSENGDGFYAIMVQARRPVILESLRKNIDPSAPAAAHTFEAILSAKPILVSNLAMDVTDNVSRGDRRRNPTQEMSLSTDHQAEMRMASALGKWGRPQIGRRLLRLLPTMQRRGGAGTWVESFRLALDLKDYAYGFKSPLMLDSPLRQIPNSSAELEVHMLRYNPDWKILYPFAYRDIVEAMASSADVDPFLLLSLMRAESVYDIDAQSAVGAQGLMQIMPFTAIRIARMLDDSQFHLTELRQPEINIGYAAQYIKKLSQYYRGNMILAVAAYNSGPTSVDRWLAQYGNLEMDELIETMTFRETRRYVKSVYRNLSYYKYIWQRTPALAYLPKVPSEPTGDEIF